MTSTATPAAPPRSGPRWHEPESDRREVFVPLSHPPGEAQYDFGEATVTIAGVQMKAALSVMTLPYSEVFHVSAYPRECTETFQAGHVAAFTFFGGVPTRISYDNSRIAVTKVMGRERDLTREFLRLESHFLFAHHFCRWPGGTRRVTSRAWWVSDGGTSWSRCRASTPSPHLNAHLEAACLADMDRSVRGKPEGKAQRLEVDRAAMLTLPAESFDPRRVAQASANSLSLVRFDRNDYSVPTAHAHHEVIVLGGTEEVRIVSGTEVVARHPRCWSKEEVTFDPRHYLALLERKPGALDHARPLEGWDLPACFPTFVGAWRQTRLGGHQGVHQGAASAWSGHRSASSPEPSRRPSPSGPPGLMPSRSSCSTATSDRSGCSAWTAIPT